MKDEKEEKDKAAEKDGDERDLDESLKGLNAGEWFGKAPKLIDRDEVYVH